MNFVNSINFVNTHMYVIQFCKVLIISFFGTIETFHVNKVFYFMKKHLIFWLTLVGGTTGSQSTNTIIST